MLTSKCCGLPDCEKVFKSSCSVCLLENYCSSECQKKDWKKHKLMCPMLKRLSNKLQHHEVVQVILEILDLNDGPKYVRVFEHLLSYAEYQFGERVEGKSYRERADGERISNWNAEFQNIFEIISKIIDTYIDNRSRGLEADSINRRIGYLEKSFRILNPWFMCLDSDVNCQIENFNKGEKSIFLDRLTLVETQMAEICLDRSNFDEAAMHCERMLSISKVFDDDDEKVNHLFQAISTHGVVMYKKGDYVRAKEFAEEAYNVVAVAYNPVHPKVQEAASMLIRTLFQTGDLEDAERFSEVTYGYLKDPANGMNQEGYEVATGGYNYADAIKRRNGDLVKAEKIIRESLRIREILGDNGYRNMTKVMLIEILNLQRTNKLSNHPQKQKNKK